MADEIEKFQLEELKKSSDEVKRDAKHKSARSAARLLQAQLDAKLKGASTASAAGSTVSSNLTRDKLYHFNNLLDEWQMLQSKKQARYHLPSFLGNYNLPFQSVFSDCKFSGNINRELQVKGKPKDSQGRGGSSSNASKEEGGTDPRSIHPEASPTGEKLTPPPPPHIGPEKVYGLDDKALSLQRFLTQEEKEGPQQFKAIGIVGIRGIGKTTLCQLVYNNEEVKKHFPRRIWVSVSKQPEDDPGNTSSANENMTAGGGNNDNSNQAQSENDKEMKEIVKRMLKSLSLSLEDEREIINSAQKNHGLKLLLLALRLELSREKYLIVLDDVRGTDPAFLEFCSCLAKDEKKCGEKLAYGLPKGKGGAVIVTSRTEELAKKMVGEENLHRLHPLPDPDCWNIFTDSYGKGLNQTLKILEEKILDKCGGLPLAAKMLGQIALQTVTPTATATTTATAT